MKWIRHSAFVLLLLVTALSAACSSIGMPPWFAPGTAPEQRARAVQFDPYPDPEVGPNDYSARPLGYLNPLPEADRAARSLRRPVPMTAPW